ncbi:ATP-grasp domain-containing protein [Nitrincola sp.]|uniref:ATP-grasp domain-containing protein n=1 Tax=Nitrincola sp. TaxID=1926584 RepID=UPI003A950F96
MITFTTCKRWPLPGKALQLVCQALEARGLAADCVPWQEMNHQHFAQSKVILPLAAWDYSEFPEAFVQWLSEVAEQGVSVLNAPELIQWNMNKRYLLELADKGVHTIPTRLIKTADPAELKAVLSDCGWDEVVLKPACGQSGNGVQRYSAEALSQARLSQPSFNQGWIVQPFMPEIQQIGEVSLCFLWGEYSHAVRRMPATGEWRANSQYNVAVSLFTPDADTITTASNILQQLPSATAYARVDGLLTNEGFVLSELELIEPALFLDLTPVAVEKFCSGLAYFVGQT